MPITPETGSLFHAETHKWRDRRKLLLRTAQVHSRLQPLIEAAKANTASLAVFKPTKVIDFLWEEEERNWDAAKVAEMRTQTRQTELFAEESWREAFKVIPKLPYSFSYKFSDADGRQSTLQILDWEIGALYWNCLKLCDGQEAAALDKVKEKYFEQFLKTDLHFFLGTTQQYHQVAPNPWVIIGVMPIPFETQPTLF